NDVTSPESEHMESARRRAAAALMEAARTGDAIAPLTEAYPDLSVEDAYAIQSENIAARLDAGARIVGRKVGLTSRVMQEAYGVDDPDYGTVLDDMCHEDGAVIPIHLYLQPRVEVEVAFMLADTLRGPDVTADDVRRATRAVAPSIEIIASRIADWKITLPD